MGKTLTSILLVAAAVVVNVVPGIGQAISGAILSTVGTSFAAIGIVSTGLQVLGAALTFAGIQAGLGLLGVGPNVPKPETTARSIKTSIPPRVSAYGTSRLYFAYALYETAEDGTAVDVGAVHDGKMDGLVGFYLDDGAVTITGNLVDEGDDGRWRNSIHIYHTDGSNPGTAFSAITALLPSIWTTDHRGDGVVMLALTAKAVKAKNFQEIYPSSTVPAVSMVARWQQVFDWRDGTQSVDNPATWKWSENSILHLAHYMLVREGKDWAVHFAPTLAYWTAAANDCDVAMALKAGGTEARYRSCLAHKHTDEHKVVRAGLLATCDGWVAPRADGALVVYSGRYYAPIVNIGPDAIVSYNWEDGVDDENVVNEIIVSYVSAAHDYNSVEADPWRDTTDISARGSVRSQPLENQVPSHAQARRLAKRVMARVMAQKKGTVTTNRYGRVARGQRYINLHIEEAGAVFYSGPAEITQMTRNLSTGGVTFSWVEADPNIDNWDAATEEGEPAATGDRVAAAPLAAPTIDSTSSTGGTLTLDVTGPSRDDLTWFVQSRTQGATLWGAVLQYPDSDPGPAVTLETDIVPAAAVVEVQVSYQIGDGRVSPWSATATINTPAQGSIPNSFIVQTGIITASDAGTTASIGISSHTRRYPDKDVTVNAGSVTGLAFSTTYYIYYDDTARLGGSVTYAATTSITTAGFSSTNPGRHFVGSVTTPADGGGSTSGSAGNAPWTPVSGYVAKAGDTMTGELILSNTSQLVSRLRLAGQEFYQSGNSSTDGIAVLIGVNRSNNRQLWLADSANLAQNTTNATLWFHIDNTAHEASIGARATNGTSGLPLHIKGSKVKFDDMATTANAANVYADSGDGNNLLRSTSSGDYKTSIELITDAEADAALRIDPIRYQSLAEADDPQAWFYGFVSEDALQHVPELVNWGYRADDYDRRYKFARVLRKNREKRPAGLMYERMTAFHQVHLRRHRAELDDHKERIGRLEEGMEELRQR